VATWLDQQAARVVRSALGSDLDSRECDERRFNLWLALVDLHLAQLKAERSLVEWDWRSGYKDGWSPRAAALQRGPRTNKGMAMVRERS
jgi:hypothetical protein